MKNILVALALFFATSVASPNSDAGDLIFNQTVADCENSWFASEAEGGKVILGYVYIDPTAGFTFEHYGTLEKAGGKLRAVPSELSKEARLIERIGRNFKAACLTANQAIGLDLPATPESMKFYLDDRPLGEHHTAWAYHYNHVGASDKALEHVTKAISAGAESKALTFEHAFALNALERFDETVYLLEPVIASGHFTPDIIAELAYARLMQGNFTRSIELYTQAIDYDQGEPSSRRWEFATNIASAYEKLGDTRQRDAWKERSEKLRDTIE